MGVFSKPTNTTRAPKHLIREWLKSAQSLADRTVVFFVRQTCCDVRAKPGARVHDPTLHSPFGCVECWVLWSISSNSFCFSPESVFQNYTHLFLINYLSIYDMFIKLLLIHLSLSLFLHLYFSLSTCMICMFVSFSFLMCLFAYIYN